MPTLASTSRRDAWQALGSTLFDLLVVGGGITGAGIARDAAMRGLKVALVDKGDFGAGTSSKSSKLIHGGLRYLQQAEFGLVFEAVSERTRLLKLAPHLVRPLSFLFPSYKGQFPGLFALDVGLWLYDALSKFASPARHRTYRKRRILQLEPGLNHEALRGGIVYFDSMTDDARLTLENVIDARQKGAVIASYAQVTRLLRDGDAGAEAPIRGAEVVDLLGEEQRLKVQAKVTVNATGPWSDELLGLASGDSGAAQRPLLRPTKGVHVVLANDRLPVRHAVVMTSPRDGRVLFAIPWTTPGDGPAGRTVLGTTDTDFSGDPDQVAADAADVDYLLSCANHYFPGAALQPADVLSTWAGLRPLVAPQEEGLGASDVSREHRLIDRPGLITIAGGKLTTYRRMAAQVVEAALGQLRPQAGPAAPADGAAQRGSCPTDTAPLPGAQGLGSDGVAGVALGLSSLGLPGLDPMVAQHLAGTYGVRAMALGERLAAEPALGERLDPELPYIYGEVDLAVQEEAALRLEDVLSRRLPLLLRARDQGLGPAPKVARRMAGLLGWSADKEREELARYEQVVALSRKFRQAPGS